MTRLLLTGAAGDIATLIRPLLAPRVAHLRLSDVRRVRVRAFNESSDRANLRDARAVRRLMKDMDAVVHLGAITKEGPLDEMLDPNIRGVENVLAEAVDAGVRHVILASSMHVLGMYPRSEPVHACSPPRPDSRYALTKLMTEEMGRLYALKQGLRVTCVRIGCFKQQQCDSEPGGWIGPEDLTRLLLTILQLERQPFRIVHAVSPHAGDDSGVGELADLYGFQFRHRGPPYQDEMAKLMQWYPNDPAARHYRGGEYASATLRGPHSRIL